MRARTAFALVVVASLSLAAVLMWPRMKQNASRSPAGAARQVSVSTATSSGPAAPSPSASTTADVPDASAEDAIELPPYSRVHPASSEQCPQAMVLVDGVYCPFVAHRCAERLADAGNERCARYRPELICEGRPSRLRFCIDRFEYPNLRGVRPVVMVDFFQAEQACAVEGKRLCEAEEWTLACEGPGIWPYPYGLERDDRACNIDRELAEPDLRSFARPREISIEVERLDQRVASGSMPRCVSPYGVHDMTGNVDEWVHNRRGHKARKPYETGLKGGYWGPIRARCRPMTTSHNGWFRFYQAGFRCCADPRDGQPTRETLPRKVRLPRRQQMTPPPEPPKGPLPRATE